MEEHTEFSGFDPERMKLVDIRIVHGQLDAPEAFDRNQIESYDLGAKLDFGINMELKQAKVDLWLECQTNSGDFEQPEATGNYKLVYIFQVENLDQLAAQSSEGIGVHPKLLNALASVAYSTSRGILHSRFLGTALEGYLLPIVSPEKLLGATL